MSVKNWLVASTALAGSLIGGVAFAGAAPESGAASDAAVAQSQPQTPPPSSPAAQSAAQTGSRTGPQDNLIGEVIVTAEKREQSLQTVPVAISAFTSAKRDLLGIESVVDQTNYTPGLTYTAGNDRLSLRGVGRLTNIHTADSGTAIYTDGVFLTSATQAARSPLFIERTEILRGPQGTLYGRTPSAAPTI